MYLCVDYRREKYFGRIFVKLFINYFDEISNDIVFTG